MVTFRDLSGLPPEGRPSGDPPLEEPVFAPLLAKVWADEEAQREIRPLEPDSHRTYYTMAGKCARADSYQIRLRDALIGYDGPRWQDDEGEAYVHAADAEGKELHPHPDYVTFEVALREAIGPEDIDLATYWTFGVGNSVHERWQHVVPRAFDGKVGVEVESFLPQISGHGYADLVLEDDDGNLEVIEIKSVNGFGFKMMVGARGPAEGPRWSALLQGALNAHALGASLRLVYVAIEKLSDRELAKLPGEHPPHRKFLAEWAYTAEQVKTLAEPEIHRLAKVLEVLDEGRLAPRQISAADIPIPAQIIDPVKGLWAVRDADGQVMESGTYWECNYCSWRPHCLNDGPGQPPASVTVELRPGPDEGEAVAS